MSAFPSTYLKAFVSVVDSLSQRVYRKYGRVLLRTWQRELLRESGCIDRERVYGCSSNHLVKQQRRAGDPWTAPIGKEGRCKYSVLTDADEYSGRIAANGIACGCRSVWPVKTTGVARMVKMFEQEVAVGRHGWCPPETAFSCAAGRAALLWGFVFGLPLAFGRLRRELSAGFSRRAGLRRHRRTTQAVSELAKAGSNDKRGIHVHRMIAAADDAPHDAF